MRSMLFLTGVLLGSLGWAGGASAGETLTLTEALGTALAHNRAVASAAAAVDSATAAVEAAAAQRLPTLNATGMAIHEFTGRTYTVKRGQFGEFESTGPIPATDVPIHAADDLTGLVGVEADLPLSQQYRIGLGIATGETGRAAAEESLRRRRQEVVSDVRETYHAIVAGEAARTAARESVTYLRDLEALAERYEREGTLLAGEVLDARAKLADAERRELAIANALDSKREALNQLLGRDLSTPFEVADPDAESKAGALTRDPSHAAEEAVARRPEIRLAALEVERADLAVRAKRAEYIPDVTLVGSYTRGFGVEFVPDEVVADLLGLHQRVGGIHEAPGRNGSRRCLASSRDQQDRDIRIVAERCGTEDHVRSGSEVFYAHEAAPSGQAAPTT